jgi:hypothetical protein
VADRGVSGRNGRLNGGSAAAGVTAMDRKRTGWYLVAIAAGAVMGLVIAMFSISTDAPESHSSVVVVPLGTSWSSSPPAHWCASRALPSGGAELSCGGEGPATIFLHVNQSSRLTGSVEVTGPSEVWVLPWSDACPLSVELSGYAHSCAIPVHPSPWSAWHGAFGSAGAIDLSRLPLNVTPTTGLLPSDSWELWFVDALPVNETVTVTSPIELVDP